MMKTIKGKTMKLKITTALLALCSAGVWGQITVNTTQTDNTLLPDYVAGTPTPVTENIALNHTGIENITSVSVTLDIAAGDNGIPFNGDYYAYLQHGSGFSVLLNRVGVTDASNPFDFGYSDEGMDITVSDGGYDVHNYQNTSYTLNADGQLTGDWAPDGRNSSPQAVQESDPRTALLNAFDGAGADGTWTLLVEDESQGSFGVLGNWSLDVTGTGVATVPDGCSGLALMVLSGAVLALFGRRIAHQSS
jgi:hypothetical protein